MLKWLKREKIAPICLSASDSLALYYNGEFVMQEPVGKSMVVNEVGIFRLENEEGFRVAIGGVFGESE